MSNLTVHEKVINGTKYATRILGAKKSLHVKLRLARLLEPAFAAAIGKESLAGMTGAAFAALRHLTPEDLDFMCETFGEVSTYTPEDSDKKIPLQAAMLENWFTGKDMELFEWLYFCLEANYRPFITAALSKLSESGIGDQKAQ